MFSGHRHPTNLPVFVPPSSASGAEAGREKGLKSRRRRLPLFARKQMSRERREASGWQGLGWQGCLQGD